MFWSEADESREYVVPDNVMDVVFRVDCHKLPVDHAWELSRQVLEILPWIENESGCGIHLVHGAESGNGWQRPADHEHILLSRRTRFSIRVPKHRVEEASRLNGARLCVHGCEFIVGQASTRKLSDSNILFSRHVHQPDPLQSENDFLQSCLEQLHKLDINTRKMMCGRVHHFTTPEASVFARSLMLADLDIEQSVRLQEHGLGQHRAMGLGLFIPHRGIDAVYKKPED